MALVQAARTFDPHRKVSFATYARHRIRGALRDYVRFLLSESWRGKDSRPAFESLSAHAEQHGHVMGITRDLPIGAEIESLEVVESWLQRLPETHALACRLIYIGGKPLDEVARLLGLSRSCLHRLHAEALSLLIEKLNVKRENEQKSPPRTL
jgi:RNA polymerase sporulation-specific sigma factor